MPAYKPWTDRSYLHDKYVVKRMKLRQIVEDCENNGYSVTEMTIYNNLKKFGMIKNSRNLGSRSVGGTSKNGFYG